MLRSTDLTVTSALGILLVAIASADTMAKDMLTDLPVEHPLVIGHRGASGYLPEHTLAAYFIAIEQGADYIEPDLVMTKDGVLVARHENALAVLNADGSLREATTDVADRSELADRKTTKRIDGVAITGWFTEDFTLAELKTLRARERLSALRSGNARLNGSFEIPTFEEVINLVQDINKRRKWDILRHRHPAPDPIGIYPETKHPSYFDSISLSMDEPLVTLLHKHGYNGKHAPVYIQSFEVGNLKDLRKMTRLPLVQLLNDRGKPYDFVLKGDPRTYADLAKPKGLAEIASYADGVGVNKNLISPRDESNRIGTPTTLVQDAHAKGLIVHGWTFRAENAFLPANYQSSSHPAQFGDLSGEIKVFLDAGMDGFFTDHPDIGVKARDEFVNKARALRDL
jgi:glycerophosphoryl diester phosphodiesterase